MLRNIFIILITSSSLLFTACGGGGNDGPSGSTLTLFTSYNDYSGEVNFYTRYTLNNKGKHDQSFHYTDSGPDMEWFTDDDGLTNNGSYHYDDADRLVQSNYYSPGADLIAFTDDDVMTGYRKTIYSEDGLSSRRIYYIGSGPDGVWQNSDDVFTGYNNYEYDGNGNITQVIYYEGVGPDGDWFTSDDLISPFYPHSSREYDQNNNLIRITYSNGDAGADGTLFTNDDIQRYHTREFNGKNVLISDTTYFDPGADGNWLTNDDVIGVVSSYSSLDENGNPSRMVTGTIGDDQVWNSETDAIYSYSNVEYDPSGIILKRSRYNWYGDDMQWFTADDTLNSVSEYTLF